MFQSFFWRRSGDVFPPPTPYFSLNDLVPLWCFCLPQTDNRSVLHSTSMPSFLFPPLSLHPSLFLIPPSKLFSLFACLLSPCLCQTSSAQKQSNGLRQSLKARTGLGAMSLPLHRSPTRFVPLYVPVFQGGRQDDQHLQSSATAHKT